jgi:hypothetical protein
MYLCFVSCKKNPNQMQGHTFEIFPVTFKIEYMVYICINLQINRAIYRTNYVIPWLPRPTTQRSKQVDQFHKFKIL